MTDIWTANVVAQLRMLDISQKDFAKRCGYSAPYLSIVLRGHKDTRKSREKIDAVLRELKQEKEIYI